MSELRDGSRGRQRPATRDLAFHLVAVHKNAAAIANPPAVNLDCHQHEHFGPGGLRLHPWTLFSWDEQTLEDVLEEAEEMG